MIDHWKIDFKSLIFCVVIAVETNKKVKENVPSSTYFVYTFCFSLLYVFLKFRKVLDVLSTSYYYSKIFLSYIHTSIGRTTAHRSPLRRYISPRSPMRVAFAGLQRVPLAMASIQALKKKRFEC